MTPEQGIQHFSSKEERDKIVFCAVLGPLIKGGKNQILLKLSPRDRRPSGHLVSLEHSDGSPGPQWPYLMSTGMSQLGGSRICLLTPSASQTCLPDCLLEPGWSLERVPEHSLRCHLLLLATRVPLCAWVLLGKVQCQPRCQIHSAKEMPHDSKQYWPSAA